MQPTLKVARELLGLFLVRKLGTEKLIGKIVEVEAYLGSRDPASHAYRGRTPRNDVMFWKGGHLYVYFTYGMHFCANVVTGNKGIAHAVLLRAVEPVEGIDIMRHNRKLPVFSDSVRLCSGPARLGQAFGLGRKENGVDLCGNTIWIAEDVQTTRKPKIARTTRVGITVAKQHQWRLYLKDNLFVSPGRPV
ncbi:MAG: DNA-3-methyladenine glycosylase [Bacteroidetes bacterium]|nr:DNA-3-methyladenine glycosylase [Bacteroidota bacterium]